MIFFKSFLANYRQETITIGWTQIGFQSEHIVIIESRFSKMPVIFTAIYNMKCVFPMVISSDYRMG